jgi:hypothetical protein
MGIVQGIRTAILMRYIAMAIALLSFAMPSVSQAKERKILISSFKDIVVEGDLIVNIVTGKSVGAFASGDKDGIESLRISQSSDQLKLTKKPSSNANGGGASALPLTLTISNRALRNITIRGNGVVQVNSLRQTGNSSIKIYGSGQVSIDNMSSNIMDVAISGSGRLAIGGGSVRDARVSIDGSGSYMAEALNHKILSLSQNGGSEAAANVSDSATISNNGAGNVNILGKGKCTIARTGTGTVNCASAKKSN